MTNPRTDAMCLVMLGSLVLILLGGVVASHSTVESVDFRAMYFPARCLLQHGDPYSENEVLKVAKSEGGERPADVTSNNHFARYLYPPSTLSFTVPLALMPWRVSRVVWIVLTGGLLIIGAWLTWNLAAEFSPVVAGALIGFLLANCELLLVLGNPAGISIALSAIAVWCYCRNRFVLPGILCLAISLALKPHDTGLVWLCFLLSGGIYRKRAVQSLFAVVCLSLPGLIWAWQVAPHWIQELRSNLFAFSVTGGLNDPGFASAGGFGLGMIVSLQTVFSNFWSDPRFYNAATYLVSGPLLLIWTITTLRTRSSSRKIWLALAAVVALTMLPVYHRQYDTKLLLLTVPGCAALWAEGGAIGWLALVVNIAAFVLTGDLSWIAILKLLGNLFPTAPGTTGIIKYAQIFTCPLVLLSMGIFYSWVYIRGGITNPDREDVPIHE